MPRRRSYRRRSSSSINRHWATNYSPGNNQQGGTSSIILTAPAQSGAAAVAFGVIQPEDYTVLRTFATLQASLLGAASVGPILCGFGIGVINGAATVSSLGAGQVPRAISEGDWDGWYMHQTFYLYQAGGTEFNNRQPPLQHIDSKAKRRVQQGDALFLSFEMYNDDLTATASVEFSVALRGLTKDA